MFSELVIVLDLFFYILDVFKFKLFGFGERFML